LPVAYSVDGVANRSQPHHEHSHANAFRAPDGHLHRFKGLNAFSQQSVIPVYQRLVVAHVSGVISCQTPVSSAERGQVHIGTPFVSTIWPHSNTHRRPRSLVKISPIPQIPGVCFMCVHASLLYDQCSEILRNFHTSDPAKLVISDTESSHTLSSSLTNLGKTRDS
jgi:hypothetical protein